MSNRAEQDAWLSRVLAVRLRATIAWPVPAPVDWVPGGFLLGGTQLNATTAPPGLDLVYDPDEGKQFAVGEHSLTVSLVPSPLFVSDPKQVTLTVRKARARIVWTPPDPVAWTPGGFVPDASQLNAVTEPAGVQITYTPATSVPLPVGTHDITASIAADEPYEAEPVTVSFVVEKAPARIEWATPAPAAWVPGGFVPDQAQLNAATVPPGLNLTYSGHDGGGLEPGAHTLTATLEDSNYQAAPKQVTLTVTPADPTLRWNQQRGSVDYRPNITLPDRISTFVANPQKLALTFNPPVGSPLVLGSNVIAVTASDAVHYDQTPATMTLTVRPAKATISCEQDLEVPAGVDSGFVLDVTFLGATTDPPGLPLVYDPPDGTSLYTGYSTITISLDPTVANYAADPVSTTVEIVFPPKAPPDDEEDDDVEQDTIVIKKSTLAREYPYGGGNVTPHIHQYGSSFHIKLAGGDRLNLVQKNRLYPDNVRAARAAAAGNPRLLATINALVAPYE